jgi:ABC-2 type transport system ATP-binding protein
MSTVLEIHNLTKEFGSIVAVKNIDLSVNHGEMFCLVGPDGAGKTTTIRLLCGILKPSSGKVKVLGFDVETHHAEVKKRIGYLSQRFSLYADLSIDENIEFFAEIHQVHGYKPRRDELLEFTRLAPFRNRLAERLSGGMKQKLALACTLIHTPEIIFLDEPTTGVDPVSRRDFWRILSNLLTQGITIFMSTPYLDEAERCSRVALMNKGSLMVVDTPQHVREHMKGEIAEVVCEETRKAQGVLSESELFSEVQAFGDRLHVVVHEGEADVKSIRTKLVHEGITVKSVRLIPPSLENVFISLMTEK